MTVAISEWVKTIGMSTHLAVATFLRLVLIAYGQQQDMMMEVKYTDVDYHVFTDGARHVWEGRSPYDRHTYRYSPLLAYMMVPNMWSPSMGKLIFVLFDIFAGHLLYCILRSEGTVSESASRLAACAWLHNPLVMNVSTRGSAESVIVALVLLTIHLYQQKVFLLTGLVYGLAIHLKIYPLIFCLSLYVPLTQKTGLTSLFDINVARVRLVSGTIFSLVTLTILCHHLYGWQFIEETYLYHITRKDSRHNFSVYFYMLYLTVGDDDIGLNILTFLPQVLLLVLLTYKYSSVYEVNFCIFCQTLVFVTFNKVVTAQYFLWYLSLLPLILPSLLISAKQLIFGALLWGFAQASWLLPAYLLEFKGNNTFFFIWLESLAFFCANVTILARLIRRHREGREKIDLQCDLHKID